jgi:putative NADH-flavin reductase
MKIVVFGATGNIGQRIVKEALRRGHEVGVVRDPDAVQPPDPGERTGKYRTTGDQLPVGGLVTDSQQEQQHYDQPRHPEQPE